jgi:hypothetical protein
MKCDMEEEAFILLESLALSIKSSMQRDIEEEEEAHIPFTSVLLFSMIQMQCDMEERPPFYYNPYCCLLEMQCKML